MHRLFGRFTAKPVDKELSTFIAGLIELFVPNQTAFEQELNNILRVKASELWGK